MVKTLKYAEKKYLKHGAGKDIIQSLLVRSLGDYLAVRELFNTAKMTFQRREMEKGNLLVD